MTNDEFRKHLIDRAFKLAKDTIFIVDEFPNKRSAWVIADQLLRAITSIGANIVEAQAASSRRDFLNFLNYALKSGNESKFWIALAKDLDPKLLDKINLLLRETDELVKILASSIIKLKGKNKL